MSLATPSQIAVTRNQMKDMESPRLKMSEKGDSRIPCGKSPSRLLFITHGPLLYGAQMSLLALLAGIDRNAVTPFLLSPREGPLTEEARKLGIQVVTSGIEHWVAFGNAAKKNYPRRLASVAVGLKDRARAIARIIEQLGIDLVYTNTVTVIEGAIAARMTHRPHVWHLREHVAGNKDLKALCPASWVCRIVSLLSTRVIVNSQALAKAYECKSLDQKVTVVHNGINLESLQPVDDARNSLRRELSLGPATKIVATIGSLTPRKGHRAFIDAASKLSTHLNGDIAFLVVGGGDEKYLDELALQVKQAGLENAFRFVGWRNDIDRILSAVDLLLVTAEQEAFGRTVIEAMAARVPVVATMSGGPEEIIVDGLTGFLVPVNDSQAMARRAEDILSDAALTKRLVEAAYLRVKEVFSIDAYIKKIEAIILNMTSQKAFRH